MNYQTAWKEAEAILAKAGIDEAKQDAWVLLEHVFQINKSQFFLKAMDDIPAEAEEQLQQFWEYVTKRANHVPVQYITGVWNFYGYEFFVNEAVLIPRYDTEILVEQSLKKVFENEKQTVSILDMCTGSGCIAVSMWNQCKENQKHVDVTAVDISEEALHVAKENGQRYQTDIRFVQSDLFEQFKKEQITTGQEKKFDVIVSNPPYIATEEVDKLLPEVKDHEPRLALDGSADGLKFYKKNYRRCGVLSEWWWLVII